MNNDRSLPAGVCKRRRNPSRVLLLEGWLLLSQICGCCYAGSVLSVFKKKAPRQTGEIRTEMVDDIKYSEYIVVPPLPLEVLKPIPTIITAALGTINTTDKAMEEFETYEQDLAECHHVCVDISTRGRLVSSERVKEVCEEMLRHMSNTRYPNGFVYPMVLATQERITLSYVVSAMRANHS